ncbi:MAG: hypothetical protein Q8914_13070 [Bacteroidota bacterium]|nr:hypothetical protein [Bacteroidota bacterium]
MKKILYFLMASVLLLVSCTDEDKQATVNNEIKIKVYSTKTWNASTFKMDSIVGATVHLFSGSDTVTAITDDSGVATFKNVKEKVYGILASKGGLCNLINKSTINNEVVGYLIIGVYDSQEEIENSAAYSGATIGGPKLADINCDGLINSNDLVDGFYIDFKYQYKDLNNDGLIDVKDLVNGNLVLIDNVVKKPVYIGN